MATQINTMEHDRLAALATLTEKYSRGDGIHATAIPQVRCIRLSAPNMRLPAAYEPSLCVILQGSKQVLLQEEIYRYVPLQFLAVSVDLPLLGQVLEATAERPYLCLQIGLDPHLFADLIASSGAAVAPRHDSRRGVFVGQMDATMQEAVLRLARLLETPQDIAMLAPMMLREIHYRLLTGAHGASIAQIAIAGSNANRIAQVIRRMKAHLAAPVRIEELAAMANMSPSSFHQHFKAITAMSPLQYHKRLRLMEARQILLSEDVDAASTAYRVGYESAAQFSREYSRMFGSPPMRDVAGLRGAL